MASALKLASATGTKKTAQVVVLNIALGMAESAGPKAMEGIIGATPLNSQVPFKYRYNPRGQQFVERFAARNGTYTCTSAAAAYTILGSSRISVGIGAGW